DPDGTGPLPAPVYNYSYDALDRTTQILGVDPDGANQGLPRPETDYTYYQPSDRKLTVSQPSPDGNLNSAARPVTTYLFNGDGLVTQATDAMGRVTAYAYDPLDRLVQET